MGKYDHVYEFEVDTEAVISIDGYSNAPSCVTHQEVVAPSYVADITDLEQLNAD